MAVLIICKCDEDSIKNEIPNNFLSLWDAQGQEIHAIDRN